MTIENAEQAAAAFVEGRVEECNKWCVEPSPHLPFPLTETARRTAAVALELEGHSAYPVDSGPRPRPRTAFLRMMAGQKETP